MNSRLELEVTPVKLIVTMLSAEPRLFDEGITLLERHFGAIDYRSQTYPFDVTNYYDQEMGEGLVRVFFSFRTLIDPGLITSIKHVSADIEDLFRTAGNRQLNIDPGYLDYHKLVLASYKYGGFKLYLGDRVYGDMTLYYSKGAFFPFQWGFPDFKAGRYDAVLLEIRQRYKATLKSEQNLRT